MPDPNVLHVAALTMVVTTPAEVIFLIAPSDVLDGPLVATYRLPLESKAGGVLGSSSPAEFHVASRAPLGLYL